MTKIVHVWYGRYPHHDPVRDARIAQAQESWMFERTRNKAEWVLVHPEMWELPRTSENIGDPQPMPYVHDLVALGVKRMTSDDDILFLTNADVGFAEGITEKIIEAVKEHGSAHMKRKEIGANFVGRPTNQQIIDAPHYVGMDFTAFSLKWLNDHFQAMPDMVWGRYGWDSCLRNLVRKTGGVELKDLGFHREHDGSFWNYNIDIVYKSPANHLNRMMLWQWILTFGGSDADHLWSDEEIARTWK